MSHVDDGALHAYLDGALDTLPDAEADRIRMHLETCEACRERLDEERSLRAEASLVLAGASPAVGEIPPFEELVREAKARGELRRAGGRIRHLAWAASLVIGLGSGWMLRGMSTPWFSAVDRPAALVESRVGDAVVEIQAAETLEESDVMEVGSRETILQDEAAKAVEAAEAEGALRFQDVQDRPAAPLPPRAAEIPMVRTDSMAVAVPEEVRASTVDARAASRDAAGRGIPVTNVADTVGQVVRSFAARQERAREDRAVEAVLAEQAAAAPEPDAERLSSTLVVPGLDVLEVAWLGGEGSGGVVRVLQVLETGHTLELLHVPPGTDPSVLEPPEDGVRELVVPRDGGWLVVRGPVERAALEALVARITAG